MAFPVDILTNVDYESLELAAEEYMSQLPYRNTEYFSLSDSKQIEIGICNVSFVPLYGTDTEKKLLALFSPDDSNTVLGLYLLDRWWGVEDVLKTAEPSKTGLIKVSTLGERIVLYVLNRIVLRNEKTSEDVFFLCHCEHESAKILWKDGEAIGFYSFKPKGSLCRNFVTQCYHLPVMDTIFVRKCHRGEGHGVKILEDFVGSFRNEYIGLKFPLSEAMYKVSEKYFSIYPADKELLWEVEKIGSPFQRTLIANRLQKLKLKEKDQVVSKLNFEEDVATAPMEIEITKEETIIDITKEVDDIPVTRRGRGSNLKRRAIRENSEERLSENIFRVEDIEAGVESSIEMAVMENLNTVKESEMVLRSSVDTVTATMTNFAELRESQKEEAQEIEKDIVTAKSEGTPVTHLTTAGEIKSQRGSKVECEMVIREYTVEIQGATIGSIGQSQLQSVVDVEIVKMSTGTEDEKNENLGKNKEVEEDNPVCETEKEEIKQMLDEPKEEETVSETEVAEQSETHAKSTEKEHWDVEIIENKERAEDEVMAESGMVLTEENRDDNIGQEKSEAENEDTVLQQSVEDKYQTEMESDPVTEVFSTEDVLCDQPKQNEAETEVSEPNQMFTNEDTLSEKASKNKLGPDEAEQVFTKSKLPQKRTSALTPSRRSKRLRHQPAEKDLRTTKSVKTVQQRYKHHSKAMVQDDDIEQSTDEPEHDVSEVVEKIQEAQVEEAEAESEVEEYKGKDMLTVETVSTMDVEITQVEETVFPEVSELVEREEEDQEEAPQQSSVDPPEIQESKTTPEEDEETVENSTVILTLSEAKVVLVNLHKISPKEADDNRGETDIPEQEEMKHTMSSEQQATLENMRKEEQDGTLDTKTLEEPACTTTTEGYDVAADTNRTLEQSATYKDQEGEPESETTEVVLLSQVKKPEKTNTEQAKEDKQDSYEADKLFPKQGKQTQKKGSIDTPSRSTGLKDQPVDPGVTVRCLRSNLKPVKITPVRRTTRSKALIQQIESVEPHAKLRTDENPETDEDFAEDVSPEENKMANTNVDETASVESESSELLKPAEIDDKEKEPQITKVAGEILEEGVTARRVEDIKKMENKEANLAGQIDSDIEMSSLSQEVHVQEEEVPVSTERHLRRRTIRIQTPLVRKSRCVQKQKAEADVEHQEKHTVVSKNVTETILMTKERDDEIDQNVNKMENKEEHLAKLEQVEEPNMSRNEYEKTSATTEETVNVCIPIVITETSLESLDEMVNKNIEETAVPDISELPLGVEIDDQEKEFQIVDGPEEKVSLVEPGKEVENDDGTPVIKLQRATVVLVDLSKLSQNTEEEGEASEDLTHFQTEEKMELDEPDKCEQDLSNLASEKEKQQEEVLQTQEYTEKTPEEEKMEEENTAEEPNKLDKQDMTFEEQKPTEDLATMPAEGSLVESNKIENNQTEDEGVSSLAQENAVQENLEEEAPVSTQRSLRRRTIRVQSPPRRKSRGIQKQESEVSEDKTEIDLITEKEADEVDQGVEIDDKGKTPQTSTVDGTEKVVPPVEAEPEDDVAEKGVEEINKMENKETNLSLTKETSEEATEAGEEASLEQRQNEPLDKNDKETAETETSMDTDPVVAKEQTYLVGGTTIQIEEKVSKVSLVEAEPDEEVEKDDGTPVIQLQKATVILVDLSKLSQNTEEESNTPEVLTHSQTEEKLEQDKPDNSEYQLCNLASEEEEQQEQLQKEEDTEKTPEKDKMDKEKTAEEQNEPNEQDMTFQGQKPTEDLVGQNDLIVTEIVEVYRAVDEDVEEAVKSGEHPEKTTMADKTNIIQEAEKNHNITLKEKQTDSDIEMSGLAQEAPEADQEILEEEASVSTERSLRRRTIKIQSPPRKKSRRLQKQKAEVFADKTRNIPIRGKVVEEMQETLKKSTVEATEVIPFVEAEPEDDVAEKGVEEINKMENKETDLSVTKDTDEETCEVGEEANLEKQQNEPLVKNDKETTETEKSMETDTVVAKEQTYTVGGTTIQVEKKVSKVSLVEAEPDEEVEKDDGTSVIQLQKATVVLVDLNKLFQNTEGESDTPEVLTHSQTEEKLERDKPDNSEYQLCNLTSEEEEQQEQLQKEEDTEKTPEKDKMEEENIVEEQNEPDKKDMTFQGQKPTEDLEGQNDLIATEIVEVYRAIDEDVEEALTTMADKTNIIQEAEKDHNITLKEKQTDSDIEMSGLAQEAPEADQEILEEEASVSTERSLRRRTIKIQSSSRRKSRRLQKQEAEAFEDKARNVPIRGMVVEEMHEEVSKIDDKEKTQSTVEATEVIPLLKADHEEDVIKEGFEDIVMENKKTNLAVTKDTDDETPKMGEEANLEQQEDEPLVKNDKETTETEKPMEIDPVVGKEQTYIVGGTTIQVEKKVSQVSLVEVEPNEEVEKDDGIPVMQQQIDPVVSKEQTYVEGGTTMQIEEKFSQVESTETNQSDNERITRRSLRLSAKSVTATQKTRKSTRLHQLEPVKDTNMSKNEHEETSATTEETVNVCMPVITVESNLESLDEMANTNVEETTAVEPETSELLMGEEINDKEEASQIVEEVPPIEAEPDEEAEKDDGTPVILQKDILLLVDLNKLSKNTEEQADTPEVLTYFHTEEQLELYEPDKSEYQLCNLTSEEDIQDMTVEGQKPTDDLVGENDVKERENVEEYNVVIDEDVEECVTSGEHPKATTMEDNTNIIQETENNQDISLKGKQMDSDVEMSSLGQEAPETVQEILEEEASVSTERRLRCRTIKIQSPPIRKSRRVQRQEAEVFEGKTGTVPLTGKGDEELHKEGAEIDKEEMLQKSTVEAIENIVSLTEGDPDENVIERGFEEINNMENKETNLGNEATPEMERDEINLEQQEIELSVENEKETAEIEKPMGMDEVSVVNKEQTYVLEETTIQAEEEISQMENSETNENKSDWTKRRSLRISAQSVTSTQKTRTSARLQKAELEPVKEAEMSRDEEASSMTAETVNVCVPVTIETNVENLDEDGDMVSVSKNVETTSDEQDIDISNDKGKVDEALPKISTDVEENETVALIKIPENEILVEMDKTQKDVKGGVQDEDKAETSQEKNDKEQEEAVSLGENVGETNLTNEFQITAVEGKFALESSEQEAGFITRSLRYRTVTVQSTPRSKSKRFHRQELESERETDDLNVPIGKENEASTAEDSTAEFENLETKEGEGIIQTNTDGKSEKSETKDDTKEEGSEILFEIVESNSGSQVNTEQDKTQEENLEREDMPVRNEQEEEEVSSVQKEANPLQERENEGAAEGVQGTSADLEGTAVERRTLRKRMIVETAAPRKSKRLRKQEHDDDSEQVKDADMGQTDSAEVTFTEDSVELRSDATAADFKGNNLGEEILEKIQKNAQGTKSDGDCNVHKDTEPDASESQEEQKQSRLNKTQTDEDKEEIMTDEIVEEVIEQHVDLESSTNEGFTLALEVEETSDQEENKADEESRVVIEAPKEIFTSAEKYEKGEENISDDNEKGLAIGEHVLQSSSTTASTRRKSMRLQMHESKKKTKEDESDSESKVQQTVKQTHQRKRKVTTDTPSARRSKHIKARIV